MKIMTTVLTFLMITSCPWSAFGRSFDRIQRQHLEKNSLSPVPKTERLGAEAYRLKIYSGLPKSVMVRTGETLELECEVMGNPPPNVKWLKDGKSFVSSEQEEIGNDVMQELFGNMVTEEEEDNNLPGDAEVLRSFTGGAAKVVSRLRITCITPKDQGVYSCIAVTPSMLTSNYFVEKDRTPPQTAISTTNVHVRGHMLDFQNTFCTKGRKIRRESPWIQEWWPVVMQTMGRSIVLICHAEGHPKPTVTWLDSTGKPIYIGNSVDSRRMILPTGELHINDLKWEDMGGYTCVARNVVGETAETTFLYPVRVNVFKEMVGGPLDEYMPSVLVSIFRCLVNIWLFHEFGAVP